MDFRRKRLVDVSVGLGVGALALYALAPTTKEGFTGIAIGAGLMALSLAAVVAGSRIGKAGERLMSWGLVLWIVGIVILAIHGVENLIVLFF